MVQTVYCVNPSCKQEIANNLSFCPYCNFDQRKPGHRTWQCAKCNYCNIEKDNRCIRCHWIKGQIYPPVPPLAPIPQPKEKSLSYLFGVLGIIISVVGGFGRLYDWPYFIAVSACLAFTSLYLAKNCGQRIMGILVLGGNAYDLIRYAIQMEEIRKNLKL